MIIDFNSYYLLESKRGSSPSVTAEIALLHRSTMCCTSKDKSSDHHADTQQNAVTESISPSSPSYLTPVIIIGLGLLHYSRPSSEEEKFGVSKLKCEQEKKKRNSNPNPVRPTG